MLQKKVPTFRDTHSPHAEAERQYMRIMASGAGEQAESEIRTWYEDACSGGIFTMGYGTLPAAALLNKKIRNPYSLSLLGLICAQAGSNNRAVISRKTACRALKIGPAAFAKYISVLCDNGYISRYQPRRGTFETTEYCLNQGATTVMEGTWVNLKRTSVRGIERNVGFPATQYGCIPKIVMYSEDLDVYAKAVYVVLLLMSGYRMGTQARLDFIGELSGVKDDTVVSHCLHDLEANGLILRTRTLGRNIGFQYTVLIKPTIPLSVPSSWVKRDLLSIVQTPAYTQFLKKDFIRSATEDFLRGKLVCKLDVGSTEDAQENIKAQVEQARLTTIKKAGIESSIPVVKGKNVVNRERAAAEARSLEERAARRVTPEALFLEICENASVPHMAWDGSILKSDLGIAVESGTSRYDKNVREIMTMFKALPDNYKMFVRAKITGCIPDEIQNNIDAREDASSFAAHLLNGLRCADKVEIALAAQLHKTILDGINHPDRLGYRNRRIDGREFCERIRRADRTYKVVNMAKAVISRVKRQYQNNHGNIVSYLGYVRAAFLNELYHHPCSTAA